MKINYLGKEYEFENGFNGFQIAKELTPTTAKENIAMVFNDKEMDLSTKLNEDGVISFINKSSIEGLHILRHSASHLLANAILNLYPHAKFGFGPAIEEGFYYDVDFGDIVLTDADLVKIEQEMIKIAKKGVKFIRHNVSKEEALEIFKDNPYKIELINEINENISYYEQGNFIDLCAGPHIADTSLLKNVKLLSLAGAYWRGNSNNKQLTRIYGTAFFNADELTNYLHILEERKARDHRRLGKELELFMMSEYGPGFPFWLPNGMILRNELENFWYKKHEENGYVFIKTPTMLSKELWITSGHWMNYKDNMYVTEIDEKEFAVKPMNCPGGMLVYKNSLHSYKDLPIRMGELGLVHRHEASGALNGLFRVRTFTQDDAHIFCREDQLEQEIINMLQLYDEMYSLFGLEYSIELSTRPENKYIGDIRIWDKSEKILAKACEASGRTFKINPGDGAFYGPKLDFKIRDSMNRIWQCGTIQLDMNLPERFDLSYIDENNAKVRPIMLHRALFGSIERFIGILIEHYAGVFPVWLAPTQVNILPVNNNFHLEYANEVLKELKSIGVRAVLDDSDEKLGYRLRKSQTSKIPYTIVIGDNEVNNKQVTYRKHGEQAQITVLKDEFKALISEIIQNKAKI